jgi:hypothetical protein
MYFSIFNARWATYPDEGYKTFLAPHWRAFPQFWPSLGRWVFSWSYSWSSYLPMQRSKCLLTTFIKVGDPSWVHKSVAYRLRNMKFTAFNSLGDRGDPRTNKFPKFDLDFFSFRFSSNFGAIKLEKILEAISNYYLVGVCSQIISLFLVSNKISNVISLL